MNKNLPAAELISIFRITGKTLSCAESCTGGLIGKLITDVPGSSDVFRGGFITYTNDMKTRLLGVSADSIAAYTEVSDTVAREMADGARKATGADIGISTTGYAGPGGGTKQNPVGTVFIAASSADKTFSVRLSMPEGSTRDEVRNVAAQNAMALALEIIGIGRTNC